MAKTAVIQARIDPEVNNRAQKIFSNLHISMSEAISLFLTQVSQNRVIPFELKIPNDLTSDTLIKSDNGEELHKVSSVEELFQELDS